MNLVLFEPVDRSNSGTVLLQGDRARRVIEARQPKAGDRLRVGEIGGLRGMGVVRAVHENEVVVDVEFLNEPCRGELPVTLIVAVPRPQMLKRLLATVATLGIKELLLVGSARSQRSYFSSPVLREENIRNHLELGLEQGMATTLPKVTVQPALKRSLDGLRCAMEKSSVEKGISPLALIADPRAEVGLLEVVCGDASTFQDLSAEAVLSKLGKREVYCAVGPEGGWEMDEIAAFVELGFERFHMGPRILRVETAVTMLLGQLSLIRQYGSRCLD